MSMTNAALSEMKISNMTLEGLEKEKKGAELFVPVGGGSYVKAKLANTDSIVVGVGADVAVEKSLKDAKADLETRIAEVEKTREVLEKQFGQVLERMQNNRTQMEQISAKLREGEQTGVRQAEKGA
jgi:prefoldin alpha subunit